MRTGDTFATAASTCQALLPPSPQLSSWRKAARPGAGHRPSDAPPLRLFRRPNGLMNYPSGLAVQPDYCEYFGGGEVSACPSRWCCGRVVARGTLRARGSSRRLLCRRLRTRDLFRRTASFRGSRGRCQDIARRPEFAAAALMTVSTRICSCCSPIRPAASTNCRTRTATCRDRIARSNGGTQVFSDSVPQPLKFNVQLISNNIQPHRGQTVCRLGE